MRLKSFNKYISGTVLFLDLSGSDTGITAYTKDTNVVSTTHIKVSQFPEIKGNRHLKTQRKIGYIDSQLTAFLAGLNVTKVVIEAPFVNSKFFMSCESLLKLHGYILYKFNDIEIEYVEPAKWKKAVVGSGKATKEETIDYVLNGLGIEITNGRTRKNDNIYDSFCLFVYYLKEEYGENWKEHLDGIDIMIYGDGSKPS